MPVTFPYAAEGTSPSNYHHGLEPRMSQSSRRKDRSILQESTYTRTPGKARDTAPQWSPGAGSDCVMGLRPPGVGRTSDGSLTL